MQKVRSLILALSCAFFWMASPAVAEMTANEKTLYEAAKSNGEEVTWYVAHFSAETAEALGTKFQELYPGVNVNVIRTTAQVAFQRLMQDVQAGVQQCDVISSTDVGHYGFLKENGLLMQHTPDNAPKLIEAFRDFDPDGYFHITSAGAVIINYNKEKTAGMELPKKWTDLLDPKWKDQVTVGHPGFSGYVGTWVVTMRKLYGWDYFEKLEENKPQIGRSINDTVTMLNAGERSVGAGPTATTLRSASRGNPVGVIYPEDGTLVMLAPSGIMANTKNPNASKLFMEYIMSTDASEVMVEYFSEPVRPEVAPPPGAKSLGEVKTVRPTFQEIQDGIPEVKEQWRDTFGV